MATVNYPSNLPLPQTSSYSFTQDQNYEVQECDYMSVVSAKSVGNLTADLLFKFNEVDLQLFYKFFYQDCKSGLEDVAFEVPINFLGIEDNTMVYSFADGGQPQTRQTKFFYEVKTKLNLESNFKDLLVANYTGGTLTNTFPDTLPNHNYSGFAMQDTQSYYHTGQEWANKRRFDPSNKKTIKMSFTFTNEELLTFNYWYFVTLNGGTRVFRATFNIGGTITETENQFNKNGQPSYQLISPDRWEVKIGFDILTDIEAILATNNLDGYCDIALCLNNFVQGIRNA